MLRYALYARKSDEDKKITEKSIEEQVNEWHDRASQQGLFIARTFEESKSAMKPHQRPFFTEMLSLIRKGEIDAILCWHINRLVRNMEEGGLLAQLLIDGVIKEIRTPFAMYRPGDNILPLVLEAATSTQYSLDLRDTVTRGLDGHVDRGGWNSRAYQGYRNSRDPNYPKIGLVVPDEERFPLIRKGWDMMLTGTYNPAQVGRVLNTVWGYRTRKTEKQGGTPLSRGCMYEIFSNPFYAGYVRYKGRLIKGNHQPMVTEEEFNRVQQYLRQRPQQRPHTRTFAYTGLMRCGYCGLQVTAEQHMVGDKPYIFYHCSDSRGTCNKKGVSEKVVEAEIERLLASVVVDPELADHAHENIVRSFEMKTTDTEVVYSQQHKTLEAVEQQLSNLMSMWLRGLLTDEARYKETEAKLQAEKAALMLSVAECQTEFEKMRANALHCCNYIKYARDHFLATTDLTRKREIAHALSIEYLLFGKERRLSVKLHPLLVEMVKFTDEIARELLVQAKDRILAPFELEERGSGSEQTPAYKAPVLAGRGPRALLELPATLVEALRSTCFPDVSFGLVSDASKHLPCAVS